MSVVLLLTTAGVVNNADVVKLLAEIAYDVVNATADPVTDMLVGTVVLTDNSVVSMSEVGDDVVNSTADPVTDMLVGTVVLTDNSVVLMSEVGEDVVNSTAKDVVMDDVPYRFVLD